MSDPTGTRYTPRISAEYARTLRRWHDRAYEELRGAGEQRASYLGRDLVVPAGVFPPTPVSDLLGTAVLAEVRPDDRVLDMGTGSGVNAILAAGTAAEVVGVDVNPAAVRAAVANAERNGVSARTTFVRGDLFDPVAGRFDLVVFDPPFRWFRPRTMAERCMADENYETLTRFVAGVADRLTARGRILLFFGTSGDIDYLYDLVARAGFRRETLASRDLTRDGVTVSYHTFRLSR
jgi:release factor glutamine methyltransferase